jgi:hypothetical protein
LQLILLVLWSIYRSRGAVSIAATTLGILDALALSVLSFTEHRRSIRPSSIILIYLLLSTAFDAIQCRTLWLLPSEGGLHTIASILSVSIAFKLGVLVLEAREKRSLLVQPWNRSSPEALSGIVSHSLYWWINALLLKGFKRSLNLTTLWPTDQSMESEHLLTQLSGTWASQRVNGKKHALAVSLMRSLQWQFVSAGFPRLCLIGLKFSQPLLLQRVVDFVRETTSPQKRNIGYGLIGATALIYGGLAVRSEYLLI